MATQSTARPTSVMRLMAEYDPPAAQIPESQPPRPNHFRRVQGPGRITPQHPLPLINEFPDAR